MKIGFIGLGIMGSRMAANLAKANYRIFLYNQTEEKAKALLSDRVVFKPSPAAVASGSDVVITMLSTPEAVQEVAMGENGFLQSMEKGKIWMDCSTVNPSFSIQMAELCNSLGFNFLDSPVGGSLKPAETGDLVFMVGGKKGVVKYCEPLFDVMGRKTIHVGKNGMGSALKLVNNLVMGLSMYGFIEGLKLGESLGLNQDVIFDLFDGSPVAAQMVSMKRQKIQQKNYSPEFPLQWLHKDLQLAAQTAYEQGIPLPGANTVKEIFALAKQAGLGELDFTAIYQFLTKLKVNSDEI
ncbi:MAG: NAD(P)-dependent oxidoreductase [Bacteroidales bacterium]|nr:NAD(P)-dependent oxidoreductase [Bacteroidales bacterium]